MANLSALEDAMANYRNNRGVSNRNNDIPVDVVPDETLRALKAAQSIASNVSEHRTNTVQYPFEAGTKTLDAKKLDYSMKDADRQYELDRAKTAYDISKPYSSGGGGGGSSGGNTLTERQNRATSELMGVAQNIYGTFRNEGTSQGLKNAGYPLYHTIEYILRNPGINQQIVSSGADRQTAIDNIIYQYGGVSPEEYFSKGQGQSLQSLYNALIGKKADDNEDLLTTLLTNQ